MNNTLPARKWLPLLAALSLIAGPTAVVAAQPAPAAITSSVAVSPNPAEPDSTATATFTFTADGPGSFRVGSGLTGTNGNGTFTDNGQVPELTNCEMDSTLRAFGCDWTPSGAGEVQITLQINVGPGASPGTSWDVGSAVAKNKFDQVISLDIAAPATTSTTTTTTTTVATTTSTAAGTNTTTTTSQEPSTEDGAPLSPAG